MTHFRFSLGSLRASELPHSQRHDSVLRVNQASVTRRSQKRAAWEFVGSRNTFKCPAHKESVLWFSVLSSYCVTAQQMAAGPGGHAHRWSGSTGWCFSVPSLTPFPTSPGMQLWLSREEWGKEGGATYRQMPQKASQQSQEGMRSWVLITD